MATQRIDEHTIKVLEFNAVREILTTFAASPLGRREAVTLYPSTDAHWVRQRQAETTELKGLLERGTRVPLSGLRDIRSLLERDSRKQTVLEPAELLEVCDTLSASGRLKKFFEELDAERYEHLFAMAEGLTDFSEIVDEINRCIGGDNMIRDDASAELREIRRKLGRLSAEIQRQFKAIISTPRMRRAIENENILTRNGRAVIALKANYRRQLNGVILDRSNSGATLYIEPYELAELSNELEDTLSDEKKAVWQILWQLTKSIERQRQEILESIQALGRVDLTYAKARFSIAYRMTAPRIRADSHLLLRQARHPLLLQWASRQKECDVNEVMDEIVPIDVRLGDDFDLLLVTGPNTGGKTVCLKTIGLLVLMAQSGTHIPAWADSRIPVYRKVFADIGDEQSIQQSLSTFSAHITQIINVLNKADGKSLVLLDELGAGTDPVEGSALGMAILTKLLASGGQVMATTHLDNLKSYVYTTSRAENASVQFDVQTLQPTYQLLIGTPGSSNALAIAQRLGMPKAIVKQARLVVEQAGDGSSELINEVQLSRQEAQKKRSQAQTLLDAAKGMNILAAERLEQTALERAGLTKQANREIEKTMREVRALVNEFSIRMRNMPKPWNERVEEFTRLIYETAAGTPLAARQAEFVAKVRKSDSVYIAMFRRNAVVLKIHRKRKTMIVLMDDKQAEVPFADIYEAR